MNITDNTIIKTSDPRDFYIIDDLFYIPIEVNIDEAISKKAKFIKVVVLPNILRKNSSISNSNIKPRNIFLEGNSFNRIDQVENYDIIDHRLFGKDDSPKLIKKFFSKNILSSGQGSYSNLDLFPKKDIFSSIISKKVGYFLKKSNVEKNIVSSTNNERGSSFKHFFIVYILDEEERIIESKKIDSSLQIEDYISNISENEIEDISSHLLRSFLNSIDLVHNTYTFLTFPGSSTILSISSGTGIYYILPNIFYTLESIFSNTDLNIVFNYDSKTFDFTVIINESIESTNNRFTSKLIRDSQSFSFIERLWKSTVDKNSEEEEVDVLVTMSNVSNLGLSFSDSRSISVKKEDIKKIYEGYEKYNKRIILLENFRNSIDIKQISENGITFYKFTFKDINESFLKYTTILKDLKIKIYIEYENASNTHVKKLFLDSSFNDEDNVLLVEENEFNLESLFFNNFTNVFYCKKENVSVDDDYKVIVYIDNIEIKNISNITSENSRNNVIPNINGFNIINNIDFSITNFNISNINERLTYNRTLSAINNINRYLILEDTNSDFLSSQITLDSNFVNIQNDIENITTENLSNESVKSKTLSCILFEIKVSYMNNEGESYEVKRYDTGSNLFNLDTLSYNFKDTIGKSINKKNVEVRSIVFDENIIQNLNNSSASDGVKESFCNTLYNINNKKFNFIINKVENMFFKSSISLVNIYEEIFKIYKDNKQLPYSNGLQTKIINENIESDIDENISDSESFANVYTNVLSQKSNLFLNKKNINIDNITIDRILDYKNSNIERSEVEFNSIFEIESKSSENSRSVILYKKAFKNKKYNLLLNLEKYKNLFDSDKNYIEVFHHLNFCFYKNDFNEKSIVNNKKFDIIDNNFYIDKNSFYVNKNFSIKKEKEKMLILSRENKIANFNKNFYDECFNIWSDSNSINPALFLNFVLERYVIKIKSQTKSNVEYLMISNLVDISKGTAEILNVKSGNNNLKIDLLSSKFIKPNVNVLYN